NRPDTEDQTDGTDPAFVEVASRLRELLTREYSAEVIKDSVVARELDVSRTTANRALALLARQNLIEPLPRRGWRRILLGPKEIIDLYDFRIAIEPAALSAAWDHFDRDKLQQLLDRTRRAADATGVRAFSAAEMAALDLELHHAILQACPNLLIRRAMQEQEALRVISIAPAWRVPVRSAATFQEHAEILEQIIHGTREGAMEALKSHLLAARDDTAARVKAAEAAAASAPV
ncbi:MAG TPA: GntR family transcriptional regulator, partial [Planctomycetota bacterium]|nr:GntR family transcriptional regulator [Planctomycetota bacterium]